MEALGKKLKKIREEKKLTLSDIVKETNINLRILEQIEKGLFDKLPKGIFARNFVRQYCDFIGVNADEIIEQIFVEEELESVNEEEKIESNLIIKIIIFIAVVSCIVFVIWVSIPKDGNIKEKKKNINSSTTQLSVSNSVIKKTLVQNAEKSNELPKEISDTIVEINEKPLQNNDDSGVQNGISLEKNEVLSSGSNKQVVSKINKPGNLQITAREDCWIHFTCNTLEEDFIIKAGEIINFSCNGMITFDVGNLPAISITFNGHELSIPKGKKVIKGLLIDLGSLTEQSD